MQCNKQAFTLIEALMSVAIMAIGFAGVYALVSTSSRVLSDSIDREKLNFQAAEIIESLHADQANILEYNGKDLSRCASLKTKKGKEDQLTRLKAWCQKLQGEVGDKRSQDKRRIRVVKKKVGQKYVYVVSIDLSGKDNKKTVFMKRVFNAE
jgi:type IV pilus assembly protein PilV